MTSDSFTFTAADESGTNTSPPPNHQQQHPNQQYQDNTHTKNTEDIQDIYSYYKDQLIPALTSSLPLLFSAILQDVRNHVYNALTFIVHLLVPWTRDDFEWHEVPDWIHSKQENITQFLLQTLDVNHDGHISPSELLLKSDKLNNFLNTAANTAAVNHIHHSKNMSWFTWFQYTFPLMDWKIGIFVWRSCSGLLLLIAMATIIPGRIHVWAGRIFRWPILLLTYLMILSELLVYIMVRLFIRLAEGIFTTRKHSMLRKELMKASSYNEWYSIAKELDISMGRTTWQDTLDDDTSYTYNWAFIKELISDLRHARETDDTMLALVVLRQCTRKNVGGVMNEDLFSVTNTGEPKMIVQEFLKEAVDTLKWLTDRSRLPAFPTSSSSSVIGGSVRDSDISSNNSEHGQKELNNDESKFETKKPDLSHDELKMNEVKKDDDHNIIHHLIDNTLGPAFWILDTVIGKHSNILKDHGNGKSELNEASTPKKCNGGASYDINQNLTDTTNDDNESRREMLTSGYSFNSQMQQREQVKTFLKRARAAYGRTALCLSGGGMMGCYHFGAIKALLEENVLPHIISGTSAGSVVASMICTRTDEEIERDLTPEILESKMTCFSRSWPDRFRSVYENGHLFDREDWMELISWFTCGDMTFEEAYKKTGRILCITLSATTKKAPPVMVNYITAPDVTIASAIVASAAVPGFVKPVVLRKKGPDGIVRLQGENKDESYWDGSIDQDIPKNGLAEMFNCQFFLASQCNPHIVPFFHNSKGCVAQPSRWSRGLAQDSWRGGFLLAALEMYLKADMKAKFIFLNELEAAVSFTSTMMTQDYYGGTTTIVPQVSFSDYFRLFSDPSLPFLQKCFKLGGIAAYQHCAMMKHHYSLSHALDECLALLEDEDGSLTKPRRRHSQLASSLQMNSLASLEERQREKGYSINASVLPHDRTRCHESDGTIDSTHHDDECESGGYDGVLVYNLQRVKSQQSKPQNRTLP